MASNPFMQTMFQMENKRSAFKSFQNFAFFLSLSLFAAFSNTLSGQISTTYSLRSHAITFKSDRSTVTLDPAITFLWLIGDGYTGFDNTRGATFHAEIDGNFTAGGQLLERQSTLSPFLSNFSRTSSRLPGWGRFKTISPVLETELPLIVDIAKATGFINWAGNIGPLEGINVKLSNDPINFGWGRSPLLLSREDVPYPSLNLGWENDSYHLAFNAVEWIGDTRGVIGGTTEALFSQSRAFLISGGYENEVWGISSLVGRASESDSIKSISALSLSGFVEINDFSSKWEVATSTSSFSTDGISWSLTGEYSHENISAGVNLVSTKRQLYGLANETTWSNAGIPLGVITGGDTKTSSLYFDFRNKTSTTWVFQTEMGTLKNVNYDYNFTWVRGRCSRVISESWNMFGTVCFDYIITPSSNDLPQNPSGNMLSMGIIHGISNL